jgi:hypothetical protein
VFVGLSEALLDIGQTPRNKAVGTDLVDHRGSPFVG